MTRAVLAEAREILLLMSMLVGLSGLSLAVACGAVIIADNQAQNSTARTVPTAIASLGR